MYQREIVCLDCGGATQAIARVLVDGGWRVRPASSADEARRLLDELAPRIALVAFAAALPDASDVRTLEDVLETNTRTAWVALVEPGLLESPAMQRLIASYFRDYISAPFLPETILQSVGHAYGMATIDGVAYQTVAAAPADEMLGQSAAMENVRRVLRKCARSRAPVTVTGESGTGKELAARSIHHQSAHATGPFIAVNCGAIPANLIQAELFGHCRGAFTGADRDKIGRIEAARGGTLFLDEIGDLSLGLQVNLLRFLQEGVIEKVGTHRPISVDTRVIAATHKNLEKAVAAGEFREDLYYRLNVLWAEMPPLRERADDIELLAQAYLERFSSLRNGRAAGFSRQALAVIKAHPWPGNIRELVNRVQRAVVMSDRRLVTPADLDLDRRCISRNPQTLEQVRAAAEKDALRRSLRHSGHNVAETARDLGVSRLTIYRLMEKHGLQQNASGVPLACTNRNA
ncbi:Fis family sigma-54 specific transcriptional regulator [Salinisphaera dokdonensis CL-ES53]|uniref:Fis family sigma-54 specific transcriptional regulator n=1 Tax=Salinisphaera dokdonensis CL-ES53 TaxID=1304272 RepID=A0ABV2B3A7_9GAMM